MLSGTQAEKVTGVEVFGSTTSTHNEGSPTAGTTQGWLKMKSTTYTSDIGINVQSDATIQVSCADNTITSGSAGINVATDATVTITGSGRDDQLTVKGGGDGAGIGGYVTRPNAVGCLRQHHHQQCNCHFLRKL